VLKLFVVRAKGQTRFLVNPIHQPVGAGFFTSTLLRAQLYETAEAAEKGARDFAARVGLSWADVRGSYEYPALTLEGEEPKPEAA
jgi:hypothetical protein